MSSKSSPSAQKKPAFRMPGTSAFIMLYSKSTPRLESSAVNKNLFILGNVVENLDASDWAIEMDTACTGMAFDNRVASGATGVTAVDWGDMKTGENYVCDLLDTHGVVIPKTASA